LELQEFFSKSCLTTGDIYDTIDILSESIKIAEKSFIDHNKIIVDPSIGFFRKKESPFSSKINGLEWYIRDIDILSNINLMKSLNKPICISISRKSFIGSIFDLSEDERLIPSIIAEVHCMLNGVSLIRTHNVKETRLAMNMISIINALN